MLVAPQILKLERPVAGCETLTLYSATFKSKPLRTAGNELLIVRLGVLRCLKYSKFWQNWVSDTEKKYVVLNLSPPTTLFTTVLMVTNSPFFVAPKFGIWLAKLPPPSLTEWPIVGNGTIATTRSFEMLSAR